MPFTHINEVQSGKRISSGALLDLYNVLTGVMTDQPITIANNLTVIGSISFSGSMFLAANASSVALIAKGVSGQTADIFQVQDFSSNIQIRVTNVGVLHAAQGFVVDNSGITVTAGNIGVGSAPVPQNGVSTAGLTTSGATSQYGFADQHTGNSAATVEVTSFFANPATAAAAFTCGTVAGFHATTPTKGSGSTITSAYGLLVDPISTGNTNNYGVFIGSPSSGSGNNIGLYNQGVTALIGNVGVGSTPGSAWRLFVLGATSDSSTDALFVRNSSNTNLLEVRDDATVFFGPGANTYVQSGHYFSSDGSNGLFQATAGDLYLRTAGGGQTVRMDQGAGGLNVSAGPINVPNSYISAGPAASGSPGDITANRSNTTGYLFLGNQTVGAHYVGFDGVNYQMPTSPLIVNNHRVVTEDETETLSNKTIINGKMEGPTSFGVNGSDLTNYAFNYGTGTFTLPNPSGTYVGVMRAVKAWGGGATVNCGSQVIAPPGGTAMVTSFTLNNGDDVTMWCDGSFWWVL